MSKKTPMNRLLSLLLAVAMVLSLTVPVMAEETDDTISFEQVDNSEVSVKLSALEEAQLQKENAPYAADDVVRVSIILDKASTIEAGFASMGIAENTAAMNYRGDLKAEQAELTASIQNVTGEALDVVWNLTLAANLISANVKYGQIAQIEALPGVAAVILETRYDPAVASVGGTPMEPNMAVSGGQVGATNAWAAGYTGAGSKVAIIDTGLDLQHEAFAADAFEYSLSLLDGEYDLLTEEDIAAVLAELNVMTWRPGTTAAQLYANTKVPFAFSYIDEDLDVSHYNSEHGSHVAGISAANKYVKRGEEFVPALEDTCVQGIAPDAQLLVMQVFGNAGGAYDSDYMAAIEDAIVLGADSVNLSLGSGNPGMSQSATYQQIMDNLVGSGVTVVMSGGNSGHWYDTPQNGVPYLYLDDVGTHTGGQPGSFTNSFAVASVDNDGTIANTFKVGDHQIGITETDYSNEPLATLAGEREFVFIEGVGKPEDWAALGDAVEGKVAFCYRGETSFFEKAEAAVEAGAIAVVICNNQDGVINMDLTDYSYTAPVVSITQADAALIKAAATAQEGYYTGTMTINKGLTGVQYNSDYYTMSEFSAWGIPGSLTMKPEIAAPGGNIYSVAGLIPGDRTGATGHDKYEFMSGTSMAAPQVAGMVAVLTQYVRENGLDEKTGLDARALAHSLLMSTAVPMLDAESGYYYPILQQGAGQANIGAAVSAASYILMGSDATASYADGKVKAELGDDPDRDGVYTFSFTLNNLTDEQQVYQLGADVFTQGATSDGRNLYMDRLTAPMAAATTWKVNGQVLKAVDRAELDFNGDEVINEADGQLLLDYVSGKASQLNNLDAADMNGDGEVTSYDAYLFFILTEDGNNVILPANGKVDVEVTIALADDEKEFLDYYYTGGAYVQAYVYAEAVADEEGVISASHSIPVLGFYGSWTDASMFDKGSFMEYNYGLETRAPYMYSSNLQNNKANTLYITYNDEPTKSYIFGGNPVVADDTYMPERNALSGINGDKISGLGYSLIRNAGNSALFVRNSETGEYLTLAERGADYSAFYYVNQGSWQYTFDTVNFTFSAASIPEDTALEVGLVEVPEYYTLGGADLEDILPMLGDGAFFSMPMIVDSTNPGLMQLGMTQDQKTLLVQAADNQYIAGVLMIDGTGSELLAISGSDPDAAAGDASIFALDISDVVTDGFYIQLFDYAYNVVTYRVNVQVGELVDEVDSVTVAPATLTLSVGKTAALTATVMPKNASDRTVTWSSSDDTVATVSAAGVVTGVAEGTATITATSNLDSNFKATCDVTVSASGTVVSGIISDAAGVIWDFDWDLTEEDWTGTNWGNEDWYHAAVEIPNANTIYANSFNTYEMSKLNATTGAVEGSFSMPAPMSDLAYSTLFSTNAQPLVHGIYNGWLFPAKDPESFNTSGFNLASYLASYSGADMFMAVESLGIVNRPVSGVGNIDTELLVLLDNAGYIWTVYIYPSGSSYGASLGYIPTDLTDLVAINDGTAVISFSSLSAAEDGTLYLSTMNADSNDPADWYSEIYALTETSSGFVSNLVAEFETGAFPAALTGVEVPASATNAVSVSEAEFAVQMTEATAEDLKSVTVENARVILRQNEINGGLNAASEIGDIEIPLPCQGDVEITVVPVNDEEVKIATTNGKFTVSYDNTKLNLEVVQVLNSKYYSVHDDGNGNVTVAYVGPEEMSAGSAMAKLSFSKIGNVDTEITTKHQEYNDDAYSVVETVRVKNYLTVEEAIALIREYYDEAYAFAYDYAEENGCIDQLIAAIDELIDQLKNLDLDDVRMTDEFRAELEEQIAEAIEALEAAKALILEADELDQPTLDALLALLEEANDSVNQLLELLEQAGVDITELYIKPILIPELKAKLEEAIKAGTEWLLEKTEEAYDILVAALVDAVKEYAPEVADWVYNWLYNNPETVIAFFNEYGDDMMSFVDEHSEAIAAVLCCLLNTYGEDVLDYILANGDEILVAIVGWFEIHGENTWALVKVYLDALGITDAANTQISEVIAAVIEEVNRAKAELESALNELKAMVEALKEQIKDAVGAEKLELEALLAELEEAIAKLEQMLAKLNAALDNLGDALKQLEAAVAKMIAEGFNAASGDVQAAMDAVVAAIEELVALASEETAAQLGEVVENMKSLLNSRYLAATHGEYVITPDSYLVALGDGTATGYVEKLAAELGALRGYTYNYTNLAEDGMMIQDSYSVILDNVNEIAKADLITLGFGSNGFTEFVADYLTDAESAQVDWSIYVGEEALPYLEQAKAQLREELVAAGVTGDVLGKDAADMVVAAVEAYAYSYVSYTCNLPEVVNSIHAINPDAQVIVVGMYNPLKNLSVDFNGQKINVDDYMRYMVDAANVSALTYAMVTGDVIYVDAPEVEILETRTEMSVVALLIEILGNSGSLNPSAAGHAYITEQILNALTITVEGGMLGDADGNGVVNTLDAMRVLQYYADLITEEQIALGVCDLDGNGVVNTVDAMLILQYYAEIISKFPVEG